MRRPLRPKPLRRWVHLVREIERHPCNRDGADKTWVVELLEETDLLFSSARLLPRRRGREPLR